FRLLGRPAKAYAPPDRVLILKEVLRQGLINHSYFGRGHRVLHSNLPPEQEWQTERLTVVRTDQHVRHSHVFAGPRHVSLNVKTADAGTPAHWAVARQSGGTNSRQGAQAIIELSVNRTSLSGLVTSQPGINTN